MILVHTWMTSAGTSHVPRLNLATKTLSLLRQEASVADKIVDSVFTADDDRVDPQLQEPHKPPDPADFDPIDSRCNLPVTNSQRYVLWCNATFHSVCSPRR